jgi:hypothetical protein
LSAEYFVTERVPRFALEVERTMPRRVVALHLAVVAVDAIAEGTPVIEPEVLTRSLFPCLVSR